MAGYSVLSTSVLLPAPLTPVTRHKHAERKLDGDVLQIVAPRAAQLDPALRGGAALAAAEAASAGEPIAGAAILRLLQFLRRALKDDSSAVLAGVGAEFDDQVGPADDLLLVLDDDDRVAALLQLLDRGGERADIGRVQADGWLVEHVEHIDEARAERRGERHALRFAAAERSQRPIERDVAEADVLKVGQAAIARLRRAAARSFAAIRAVAARRENVSASRIFKLQTSAKFLPPTRTASASGRSRAPPQAGQGTYFRQRLRNTRRCILYLRRSSQRKKPFRPPKFRSGTPSMISRRCSSVSSANGTSTGSL